MLPASDDPVRIKSVSSVDTPDGKGEVFIDYEWAGE
jgi:hypothetical protein